MSRHTSSPRERINIYIGNIRKLTGDCADKKHAQSICGRRLLAYGLLDTGCREIFRERAPWEEVSEYLERIMQRGEQGKPYFPAFPSVFFNISHTGAYAACAVAKVACGLDIQEVRAVKSERLLQRTLSEEEYALVKASGERNREFCRLWAKKESFLKLSGEGITRDLKHIPVPAWYELFAPYENVEGCISAQKVCGCMYREVTAEEYLEKISFF